MTSGPSTGSRCRASPVRRRSRACPGSTRCPGPTWRSSGCPFDAGVSYRPGARFGPAHIRQSSRLLRPYHPAVGVVAVRVAAGRRRRGPRAEPVRHPRGPRRHARPGSAPWPRTARPSSGLGGDHTLALPALRALHALHGPLAVLHFDAHLDTWDTYFGAPFTHGTPFRRASEEGLIDRERSRCTSASAARCTRRRTSTTTPGSASRWSARTTTRPTASPAPSSGCAGASRAARCTSRWTSTSSTRPPRPAPAPPRRAG